MICLNLQNSNYRFSFMSYILKKTPIFINSIFRFSTLKIICNRDHEPIFVLLYLYFAQRLKFVLIHCTKTDFLILSHYGCLNWFISLRSIPKKTILTVFGIICNMFVSHSPKSLLNVPFQRKLYKC
jgi:hypothetical protein